MTETKHWTLSDLKKYARLDEDDCYKIIADGCDYIVTLEHGETANVILYGDANGSIVIDGAGEGDATRSGDGKGDAYRNGAGYGNAVRGGKGNGSAYRNGAGYGHAYRGGKGNGNAYRGGKGNGNAYRNGAGYGHAYRGGDGDGDARRFGAGDGHAFIDQPTVEKWRDDIWAVLDEYGEANALLTALQKGRVAGSTYRGECACLIGTIAKAKDVDPETLQQDSDRPAERWFLSIRKGDTPENSQAAHRTAEWIAEWISKQGDAQ